MSSSGFISQKCNFIFVGYHLLMKSNKMLKMTISKIRKICSVSLIPHILRDEFTLSPSKLGKRALNGFWKMNKSTDSKDKQAECEKCKRLIEMVFGPEKPEPVLKKVEANLEDIHMDNLQKAIAPSIPVKESLNESDAVTAKEVLSVEKRDKESTENAQLTIQKPIEQIGLDILKSTTASENKEELAQKLELIEEPALVEAPTPKTEGFNTPPKVLGDREPMFDTNNSLCYKIGPEENALDEIAKKCLGSPPDKIDERIIEEMKSCGMLGRGRRKSTRRQGSYVNRSHKKDRLLETKSDESTLYCEKQTDIDSAHAPLPPQYNNDKTHHPENIYPQYFKNVPLDKIGDGHPEQETEETKNIIKRDEGKAKIVSTHSPAMVDSYQQIPVVASSTANSQGEVSEELVREKSESLQAVSYDEANNESIKKELELEKIHVTATETSRLGIPGQAEVEPDVDQKPIKPDVLTCNQISHVTDAPMTDKSFTADKREPYVTFSNYYPSDPYGYDMPNRPFNSPDTAISGTYTPVVKTKNETDVKDTAISSRQNPGEYFELSHSKMEKLDPYSINPLAIRPLEAYHPYTIISGTDDNKSQNIFLATKEPSDVSQSQAPLQIPVNDSLPESQPQVGKSDIPETPSKNISSTMGPVPELKDMEEELSLTEMLKRVRERNRLQFYQECVYKSLEVQPVEANKCTDPVDKGSQKTLGPGPCKPKPKSACPPKKCPPCPPPPPTCPPKQKDPCAKFTKTSLIGYKVKEAFSFVLHVGLKPNCELPILAYNCNIRAVEPLSLVPIVEDTSKLEKLGNFILSKCFERKLRAYNCDVKAEPLRHVYVIDDTYKLERLGNFLLSKCLKQKLKPSGNEKVILAKDYEPWVPIPSWPIPEEEKKRPFVCPKEGCKVIPPPPTNPPCKEYPCKNMPKRSYSIIDSDYEHLYIYNDKF